MMMKLVIKMRVKMRMKMKKKKSHIKKGRQHLKIHLSFQPLHQPNNLIIGLQHLKHKLLCLVIHWVILYFNNNNNNLIHQLQLVKMFTIKEHFIIIVNQLLFI